MIPQLTPDQIKQYLTDPNPIIATLALYISEAGLMASRRTQEALLPSLQDLFTDAPDRLLALYEAASGAWLGDEDETETASS